MEHLGPSKRAVKPLSPFCAGLEWTQGKLNDSSFRAFTRYAAALLNARPPHVLKEVAELIEAAGDTPSKDKLIEQFAAAFRFVAHERAAEALGSPELRSQRGEGTRSEGKWPEPDPALIATAYLEFADHTLAHWQAISPRRARTPGDVLPSLFPAGSLVCFGPRKDVHWVRGMDDTLLNELATETQFIVPNPCRDGFTIPPGRRSPKCDENFPLRRFIIVEFDRERIDPERKLAVSQLLDLQSALHAHLAKHWRWLALLVYSGHESLHGWYPCAGVEEESVISFLRYACAIGADRAFSSPSQFTRMPLGRHGNATVQTVHYLQSVMVTSTTHGKQALPQIIFPPRKNRPCFICYDQDFIAGGRRYSAGVYHHTIKKGKDAAGNDVEEPVNTWICSVLKVLSVVRTNSGAEHSYLLEYIPHGENDPRKVLLLQSHLLGRAEEALKALRDAGISVLHEHAKVVREYLDKEHRRFSAEDPDDFWQSVKTIGWAPPPTSFILPNETLGNHSRVWFAGHCKPTLYAKSDTLEEWKTNVAEPCENNGFLLLGVSTAFAGPLLELLNIPGLGFHLYGDSTSGKTTALAASCSVWGSPDLLLSWSTTINGLESQAAIRSSTVICLDESHQIDPKILDGAVYMLANGVSKGRMTKEIVARDLAHWRLPILSSGERAIETHLGTARIAHKVGQGIRLADIPVSGRFGIFDDLHGEQSGSAFADKLRDASRDCYGHAGPLFVEQLIKEMPGLLLSTKLAEIMDDYGAGLNAQEIRVARAFALAALAGELAIEWDIVPWPANQPRTAAEIFPHLARVTTAITQGQGIRADHHRTARVIEVHGADFSDSEWVPEYDSNSSRIVNAEPMIRERAGYWKDTANKRTYMFNAAGLKRASSGFKRARVIEVLLDAKAIVDHDAGRYTKKCWISALKDSFDFYLIDAGKLTLDP